MLDVGCGSGEALEVAAQRGWTGIGVELVEASAKRARDRGLDVRTGSLDTVDLPRSEFDAVVASHVLEHVSQPVQFVEALARHVRPGGVVAVEVPNWNTWTRRSSGAEWDQLCPLEHTVQFTPLTLRGTMRRAGLRPHVRTVTVVHPNRVVDRLGFGFAVIAIAPV